MENLKVFMGNKFKEGQEVYERTRPNQTLVISRFSKGIYYCKVGERKSAKELIYLERDLTTRISNE